MLPCPFCGSDDLIFWRNAPENQPHYMVACERCNASGPPKPRGEEAVEAWNHRTALEARGTASDKGLDGKSGLNPDSGRTIRSCSKRGTGPLPKRNGRN